MESCGSQANFVAVTSHLRALGLSAPSILAENLILGLLLLEDLGNELFSSVLNRRPGLEALLYRTAIDVLVELRNRPSPDLPEYSPILQAEVALRALDWYRLAVVGSEPSSELSSALRDIVAGMTDSIGGRKFFVHRDFHAANAIWLPARVGPRRVGLLDYQDAKLAHPAYDLASLLDDARRDLPSEMRGAMLQYYAEKTGTALGTLEREVAVSGAQRNLGILGVFSRLAMRDGKCRYVGLIDRVWSHLAGNLAHPYLSELAMFVDRHIPKPTSGALARLTAWHS